MEKTTRVKARVKAHALRELMENKDRLLIMGTVWQILTPSRSHRHLPDRHVHE